ncbi:Uu.00g130620.m01.CDS01 [Anthostomella pinea]|uniref:Uu.00g130620.m01.CDS01 n=1 Tax=Anthostomella pinea TaxID=933095 RepID=A0AAI8YFS5_9PEZI|nr:Uu.00g130620.m01.CDS01 [Anthostomella pinea]
MALLDYTSSSLAYAISLITSSVLIYASYLILLHPLRKFPGPPLARVTDWFAGVHAFKKDLHLEILRTHDKYGDHQPYSLGESSIAVQEVGSIHISSPTCMQQKLSSAEIYQNGRVSKSHTYGSAVRNNVDNVFTARDKRVHQAKRKMISPALTERAVKSFEPSLTEHITVYLKQILNASQASKPVNMSERARYLALDIVTQLSFGYALQAQTSDENHFVSNALAFGLWRGNVWHHLFFLSKFWVYSIWDRVFFESREKYSQLLDRMIRSRMARGTNGERDFYSFISELDPDPDNVRKGGLWWEAHFLVVAGSDTTATTIAATLFYLSRNPRCYQQLANEIRSTFTCTQDIKGGPQLASCHYLRACIDEALRLSPPVPGTLWRTQDPDDDQPLVIDGHVIPKGTIFGVSSYAIHHNEAYFPNSFAFKPERWLEGHTAGGKHTSDAFAAFSVGARSCAGKPMAYLELSLVIARMLWYFDFEPASGSLGEVGGGMAGGPTGRERLGEFQLEDIFTARHDGPYLAFHPRGELWKELESPS